MAAASFPEAQRKVQEQLDAIVGRDRGEFCRNNEVLVY